VNEDGVFASIAKVFPHVSTIRVRDALARAKEIFTGIALAVRSAAALTLVMGLLVLAGGVMASHTRRTHDAVIFQVLGATRRTAAFVFLVEHGAAGIATAAVAGILGSAAAYTVVAQIMELPWHASLWALGVTLAVGAASSLVVGAFATFRALSQSPARLLRED
jgi:putative ABC transport system permease protein